MARKGDGLYQRGSVWYLDFRHQGERHTLKIGRNIKRRVAAEIAGVKRARSSRDKPELDTNARTFFSRRPLRSFSHGRKQTRRPAL